jgi:GT2 family glycosyltransferase
MITLSILIVNWNTAELLRACLDSIIHFPPLSPYEIIVIDNASSDGSQEMVRNRFPQVQLHTNATNAGYACANNQGLQIARGENLLLLNSDTEVVGNALEAMITHLGAAPSVGALGPRLILPDGSTQRSYNRFPLRPFEMLWQRSLDRLFPANTITHRASLARWEAAIAEDRPVSVDWLVGAALMVRRGVINQIGGLDEAFWMYAEDLDWCYRMRRAGWQIVYLPTACIRHDQQGSSQHDPGLRQRLAAQRAASLEQFYRKHYGKLNEAVLRLIHLRNGI